MTETKIRERERERERERREKRGGGILGKSIQSKVKIPDTPLFETSIFEEELIVVKVAYGLFDQCLLRIKLLPSLIMIGILAMEYMTSIHKVMFS